MHALRGLSRTQRLLGAAVATAAVLAALAIYAAVTPTGEILLVGSKASPFTLTVHSSSSLPPEVQAQESASAPNLFDRDISTQHVAFADSQVEAVFEAPQEVSAVKVYGAAPYLLTVKADSGGSYQTIPGLENLNLALLPAGWNAFNASAPVTTGKLMFLLTPATGGIASGLRELEVWTRTAPINVKSGAALLEKMLGPTPLPQGRLYTALNSTANPTVGVIVPSGDNTADNIFNFTVDRDPAHFVRAYLVYELSGQEHWISVLRYVNNGGPSGGVPLLPSTAWTTQVERINTAWLKKGSNKIEFGVLSSSFKDAGYTVRNVRVLGELDNGANVTETLNANQPDAVSTNPVDALYDGDVATGWKPYPIDQPINAASPSVEIAFRKPTQMEAFSFYLSAPIDGALQVSTQRGGIWTDYPAESGSVLSIGWNTIYVNASTPLDQRVLEGVKLTFSGGAASSAEIREVVFVGSGVGTRTSDPRFVVTYPPDGEFYGRKGYLGGFLEPSNNGSGEASISVNGLTFGTLFGQFSTTVGKDNMGFAGQGDNDPWWVELKAVYPNGQIVKTTVSFTKQKVLASAETGALAGSASATLFAKRKASISHDESKLAAEAGTVASDTAITITPLADESVPALDVGMTNVTKGPRRGYRFLPHGAKFLKNVTVMLPYDKALIPPGHSEDDVKTFYFDDQAGRWIALEGTTVDKSNKLVNSLTNHFTDMINAVVTVPDHPQTVSFNPTSMKDIKAADPGAQVNLIEPPKANNMGDARVSYPIEVPPGRQGMQPQLSINYNSSGGNGWMGVGWDLSVPSITIDTRFGVPRYNANLETETYLLNGEQLTPVTHRGALVARADGTTVINGETVKIFHARVEGQFRKIIRHGNHPANYWWEVIDKNGARSIFGDNAATQNQDANSVLKTDEGNVFRWALREMRDLNGNRMTYEYETVNDYGVDNGKFLGRQLYLKRCSYTDHPTSPARYTVTFLRDSGVPPDRRPDVVIDGRGGFKQVTANLLKRIEVRFDNTLIRRYDLEYQEGAFRKTLLKAVSQFDKNGSLFNTHAFGYYDEARDASGSYKGFAASESWNTGADNVDIGLLLGEGRASALNGARSTSKGGHSYLGYDKFIPLKQASIGFKTGYSSSTTDGYLALLDITGDGLPDKVFKTGNLISYRANRSGPAGSSVFAATPLPVVGLPGISREQSQTVSAGAEAYKGANAMFNHSSTDTQTSVYFSDVNGDGLMDLVANGTVYFNRLVGGQPQFVPGDSSDTPFPILDLGAINAEGLIDDVSYAQLYETKIDTFPLMDAVRRWVAPFDGQIRISGGVRLIEDTSPERADYQTADGVRVAIQRNAAEVWAQRILATDYTVRTPIGVDAITVRKGDRIYFRVQSIFDGAYDKVDWLPTIEYVGTTATTDVNGLNPYRYNALEDFVYAGRALGTRVPLTGTAVIEGSLQKTGPTTDDVKLVVYKNDQPIATRTLTAAQTGSIVLTDLPISVNGGAEETGDFLRLQVHVDSPIDLAKLQWAPVLRYSTVASPDIDPSVIRVDLPYDIDMYPGNDLTAPQAAWSATQTGKLTVVPTLVLTTGTSVSGTVALTVKKPGVLLGKRLIEIVDGSVPAVTLAVDVTSGDMLYFDLSAPDPALAAAVVSYKVEATYGDPAVDPLFSVPHMLHRAMAPNLFPEPYRGWGAAGYNGNRLRAESALDESAFNLPPVSSDFNATVEAPLPPGYEHGNVRAYVFTGVAAQGTWRGQDDLCWVSPSQISSSRLGLDYFAKLSSSGFANVRAVDKLGRGDQNTIGGGFGPFGASFATGSSWGELDFLDMNGDRFPDVVARNLVQYTWMTGKLNEVGGGVGKLRDNANTVGNISVAGSPPQSKPNGKGDVAPKGTAANPTGQTSSQMVPIGFSGSLGGGSSDTDIDLLDINGDGLPDRVKRGLGVRFNLGYRFTPDYEPWDAGELNKGESRSLSVGSQLGFNDGIYSYGGGGSLSRNEGWTNASLVDLNGDGLLDAVSPAGAKLAVRFNTGTRFTGAVDWPGAVVNDITRSTTSTQGGGGYFTYAFPTCVIGFVPACWVIVNPGGDFSTSMSRAEVMLTDIDGDGYADFLHSTADNGIAVGRNPIGRTNLLKSVNRPLGARIDIEYARDGNTFDMPQSRFVMTKVTVHDGHVGEGADKQLTTYKYLGGFYHRLERDFYGYKRVIEEHRDTSKADALERSIEREFLNDSFYTKGLLRRETLLNAAAAPFTEMENTYLLRDVQSGTVPASGASTTATLFPMLTRTDKRFYEGRPSPGKATFTTHDYDAFGNVSRFFDAGDTTPADDIEAEIAYTGADSVCVANHLVGEAKRIVVKHGSSALRQREADVNCTTGDVTAVRQYLANGSFAETLLTYESNGNLKTVLGPPNKHNKRYDLSYAYDPDVATHVARITDSFGLSSQATYDPLFGKVQTTTDTNTNQTTYGYDEVGRVKSIHGPYEQAPGSPATLAFEYAPVQTAANDADGNPIPLPEAHHAITRHLDKDAAGAEKPSGTIDTILFIDGLKRVIQTKKDATVLDEGSTVPLDKMTVSGHVTFDALGRTVAQKYPTTEAKSDALNRRYNPVPDGIAATTLRYDVLDRTLETLLPDGAKTTLVYRFGTPQGATEEMFETTVTDANVNSGTFKGAVKTTFRDVRESILAVKENLTEGGLPKAVWTTYQYDALKQITKVIDDKNNTTTVTYDNLGRRISINNPDTGLTEYAYDLASNLTHKVTASLKAAAKAIEYDYDVNRLSAVRYPTFTGNNITYTYGAVGAPNNTAGRITKVVSKTTTNSNGQTFQDSEERQYGKLGEVVFEKKTIVTATTPNTPSVFETKYQFDTFGRLLKLTYPDGEVLTNTYDSGGNLLATQGIKNGYRYDYLKRLNYDKFEQRVMLEAGNNVKTAYTYNAQTRRLSTLTSGKGQGNLFQNLAYGYDKVGNVLGLQNQVDIPPPSSYGGPTNQTFVYDELYRLTHAEGTFQYSPNKTHTYKLDMGYDSIHNIQTKNQLHTLVQPSTQAITQKKTTYNWTYAYGASGPSSVRPHAPTHIGERTYTYDANGNQLGWTHDKNGTKRTILWNEENRAEEIADNGHVKTYKYDDQGNRTIKRGPQGETVYVNQFYTQRPGATGTKHVYAGTGRITSKLVKQDTPGANPLGKTPFEKDLYFYHPDHLGTSNYISDTNGKLYEHLEYFPFGEGWVEENSNTQRTPYLFTAKELDEETGLYYFGARYYDPRTSVWQSADPIDRFNPRSPTIGLNLYQYALHNPVRLIDPTGRQEEPTWWDTIKSKVEEIKARFEEARRNGGVVGDGGTTVPIPTPDVGTGGPSLPSAEEVLDKLDIGNNQQDDDKSKIVKDAVEKAKTAAKATSAASRRQDEGSEAASNDEVRRKPGSLGQAKGTDALRRENNAVRSVARQARLNKDEQQQLHREVQRESQGQERPLTYREIRELARELFGK